MRMNNLKENEITRRLVSRRFSTVTEVIHTTGKMTKTRMMHPTPKTTKLRPVARILSVRLTVLLNRNLRDALNLDKEFLSTDISP